MSEKKDNRPRLPLAGFDRRAFLKALGISGVAGLTACEQISTRKLIPYLVGSDDITPGVSAYYSSTCTGCPAACGLMVTVRDGRPIKLEGHPDHPLSKGGLCALGQAEIRGLYDAGRITAPTISGKAVSWTALDAQVRTALAGASGTIEILSGSITSPTARATIDELLAKYSGNLTEFDPAPGSGTAVLAAYEVLDGRSRQPSLHFEDADLVVSLASDFLGTGDNPVVHTTSYAARRASSSNRGALKHIQIEGSMSLTGAAADERWQARASERRSLAMWLLASVAQRTGASDVTRALESASVAKAPPLGDRTARLADYLLKAKGRSIVVSGSSDVGEQTIVALLNRLLGNEASTVDVEKPSLVARSSAASLDALRKRLAGGSVAALIVVGIDPVDQLADGERWKEWLEKVGLSVAITDRPTATAAACKVVAAAHHGLESWHDFEPRAGVLTLAQPTIRPLYDTRHPFENFLWWREADVTDYREHLRRSWRESVFPRATGAADFGSFWHQAVAAGAPTVALAASVPAPDADVTTDGSLDEPAPEPERESGPGDLSTLRIAAAPEAGELEVELVAQVGVRDGSRSFNPWLRELPDPVSRVSWTPTVAVAPSRAAKLGVGDGDVVSVQVGEQAVVMPVRVSPGQHPDVLGVPVGYGRQDGDRSKEPRNGYRLGRGAASVKATGKHDSLPLGQVHSFAEGRGHVHQVTGYDKHVPVAHHGEVHSLWDERPIDSPHWHMTINLDACTGCSACVIACQAENNTPVVGPKEVENYRALHWLRMDRYFVGDDVENDPEVLFQPMLCAQCDNAPCETVCPVAATVHSHDGLNHQAYNRCVGTRYCANNCPYKVRRFNWFEYDRGTDVERMVLNPDVVVRERGVMEKCTFCVQRIQLARMDARKNGEESFEVQTACQQSCPANAISFGDVADPKSAVSTQRKDPRAFQALAEVGIKPSITYLARVRTRES